MPAGRRLQLTNVGASPDPNGYPTEVATGTPSAHRPRSQVPICPVDIGPAPGDLGQSVQVLAYVNVDKVLGLLISESVLVSIVRSDGDPAVARWKGVRFTIQGPSRKHRRFALGPRGHGAKEGLHVRLRQMKPCLVPRSADNLDESVFRTKAVFGWTPRRATLGAAFGNAWDRRQVHDLNGSQVLPAQPHLRQKCRSGTGDALRTK
jgi:hypothetical protein